MKAFEVTTGANVGPAQNNVHEVPIHENYRQYRIERIVIVPLAGSAASTGATVSGDSAVASRKKQVAVFSGVTAAAPVDHDNGGEGYARDVQDDANGSVFVKLVPDAGNDNQYVIRLYIGRRA